MAAMVVGGCREVVAALLAMVWVAAAAAQSDATAPPATTAVEAPRNEAPRPLWEAGVSAFGASQTAYPGAAERVRRGLVLPFVLYRGKVFRIDENLVGVRAVKTPRTEFDIGFAASFGASSNDVVIRRGMPSIGTLFEFGPRLKVRLGEPTPASALRLELPLRAVLDVSDALRTRGVAAEPELGWRWRAGGGTDLNASVGAVIGDRRLNRFLYGVAPRFATAERPAYEAGAGLIATRLGLSASRRLTREWQLFGFARHDSVRGAANESSPLVRRSGGMTAGVGVAWTFWRSARGEGDD